MINLRKSQHGQRKERALSHFIKLFYILVWVATLFHTFSDLTLSRECSSYSTSARNYSLSSASSQVKFFDWWGLHRAVFRHHWPLARRQIAPTTGTSKVNNTTCFQSHGSFCIARTTRRPVYGGVFVRGRWLAELLSVTGCERSMQMSQFVYRTAQLACVRTDNDFLVQS